MTTLEARFCRRPFVLPFLGVLTFTVAATPALADPRDSPSSSFASTTAPIPPGLDGVGIDEHLGAAFPLDLSFRDHTGTAHRLDTYFDGRRPLLVNLMYHHCPMLCSIVLDGVVNGLKGVGWSVGRDFDVLTISIDPRDSPDVAERKRQQVLARYDRPGADRGWHFLIGDETAIQGVAKALGFQYRWDAEQQQYAHPAAIFLLTPDAKIARYLYGVEFAPRDLRFGLLEASEGRSVSTLERVLLFCYHYDATGRRYTVVMTRVLRIGGGLLILIMGAFLTALWRKERRTGNDSPRRSALSRFGRDRQRGH